MENNHLTYFKIENFKKFDSLEVNDIGQFNLIVGDNNVGKTCLLEALLFDDNFIRWIRNYHHTLYLRGINFGPKNINLKDIEFPKQSYFSYLTNNDSKKINIETLTKKDKQNLSIEYVSFNDLQKSDFSKRKDNYEFENLEHWIKFYKNSEFEELQFMYLDNLERIDEYWPYIQFNVSYSNDVEDFLRILERKRLDDDQKVNELSYNHKKELISILNNIFDIEIVDFLTKYHGNNGMISIATKTNVNYVPITQFGDGFNKIFRYLVEIMYVRENKDNRIMIDEIDTGIHYTKHKDFWVNILKVCKEFDVQLFATTHSKEFAQAYVDAAKDLNLDIQNELRLIELYHSKQKVFSGTIKDVENIDYSVKNLPFRGENIYD